MKTKTTPTLPYPPTPELDKMKAVRERSQSIGEFLEWLGEEKKWSICASHHHGPGCEGWDEARGRFNPGAFDRRCEAQEFELFPVSFSIEKLLAEFFDIDLNKVDDERRAIIDHMRSTSAHG